MRRALSESRSVVQGSSQTISTDEPAIPGRAATRSEIWPTRLAANGHQLADLDVPALQSAGR